MVQGHFTLDGSIGQTQYYPEKTNWDDERFPFTGARLDSASGRVDFNFTECTVDFAANARYPEEPVCFIAQMTHSKCLQSIVAPHIHWVQSEVTVPNWLMAYRWYNNGSAVPAFTLVPAEAPAFTYVSGDMMQLSNFGHISPPATETISSILDIKIYNDTANTSTLFAGASAVVGQAKEMDIHVMKDSVGSGTEFVK